MEKLLLHIKTKGGKYGKNVNRPAQKIFAIAVRATANIFANTQANIKKVNLIQDVLS